ncbi:tumor necrosis factor receptor superfamily member 1B isoform X2 [Brachyhypopomus gauderio]|uniref:tumor necrosis factor receptor superfamily member 1B isoform X2 n=1 Tax=Brachyhypopomus gauderio TaxID=698409 RepID=UPI0040425831
MIFGLHCLVLGVVAHLTKGKANSIPYASHGSCRDNVTEYFQDNLCCSKCMPGSRWVAHCSDVVDTICEPCQDGTYSENYNYYPNCFKCSKCQDRLMYDKHCTSVSDAVCRCKPGMTCLRERATGCVQCQKSKICPPGQGKFSGENSTQPCRRHTRCDLQGRKVLVNGTSVMDVVCDGATIPGPRTMTHTTTPGPSSSSEPSNTLPLPTQKPTTDIPTISLSISPNDSPGKLAAYCIGAVTAVVLLVLLTLAFIIRHRKDLQKPPVDEAPQVSDVAIHHSHTDCQHLLGDNKTEPSTSSSDSHSQMEHSHGVQPELPSPCVNLSITATFSCQLNPSTGSCSLPTGPPAQPSRPPDSPGPPIPDLPLSQEEELCSPCQPEESKVPLCLAQESGKAMC